MGLIRKSKLRNKNKRISRKKLLKVSRKSKVRNYNKSRKRIRGGANAPSGTLNMNSTGADIDNRLKELVNTVSEEHVNTVSEEHVNTVSEEHVGKSKWPSWRTAVKAAAAAAAVGTVAGLASHTTPPPHTVPGWADAHVDGSGNRPPMPLPVERENQWGNHFKSVLATWIPSSSPSVGSQIHNILGYNTTMNEPFLKTQNLQNMDVSPTYLITKAEAKLNSFNNNTFDKAWDILKERPDIMSEDFSKEIVAKLKDAKPKDVLKEKLQELREGINEEIAKALKAADDWKSLAGEAKSIPLEGSTAANQNMLSKLTSALVNRTNSYQQLETKKKEAVKMFKWLLWVEGSLTNYVFVDDVLKNTLNMERACRAATVASKERKGDGIEIFKEIYDLGDQYAQLLRAVGENPSQKKTKLEELMKEVKRGQDPMVVWEMVKVMFKNHELTVSKGGEEAARDLVEKAARVAAAGVVVDTKLTEARDFAQDTFNTELDTAFNALKIVNLEGVDTIIQNFNTAVWDVLGGKKPEYEESFKDCGLRLWPKNTPQSKEVWDAARSMENLNIIKATVLHPEYFSIDHEAVKVITTEKFNAKLIEIWAKVGVVNLDKLVAINSKAIEYDTVLGQQKTAIIGEVQTILDKITHETKFIEEYNNAQYITQTGQAIMRSAIEYKAHYAYTNISINSDPKAKRMLKEEKDTDKYLKEEEEWEEAAKKQGIVGRMANKFGTFARGAAEGVGITKYRLDGVLYNHWETDAKSTKKLNYYEGTIQDRQGMLAQEGEHFMKAYDIIKSSSSHWVTGLPSPSKLDAVVDDYNEERLDVEDMRRWFDQQQKGVTDPSPAVMEAQNYEARIWWLWDAFADEGQTHDKDRDKNEWKILNSSWSGQIAEVVHMPLSLVDVMGYLDITQNNKSAILNSDFTMKDNVDWGQLPPNNTDWYRFSTNKTYADRSNTVDKLNNELGELKLRTNELEAAQQAVLYANPKATSVPKLLVETAEKAWNKTKVDVSNIFREMSKEIALAAREALQIMAVCGNTTLLPDDDLSEYLDPSLAADGGWDAARVRKAFYHANVHVYEAAYKVHARAHLNKERWLQQNNHTVPLSEKATTEIQTMVQGVKDQMEGLWYRNGIKWPGEVPLAKKESDNKKIQEIMDTFVASLSTIQARVLKTVPEWRAAVKNVFGV